MGVIATVLDRTLTKAEDLAAEFGVFSRWPPTWNARQRRSNATGTGSEWPRAASCVSCASAVAAAEP